MFREESCLLRRLPPYVFETAKCMNVRVSAFSTVRFKTNTYSVPVKYVGYEVRVKGYPEKVEIYYKGELISTHTRLVGKNLFSYHWKDVSRKPGKENGTVDLLHMAMNW